MAGLRTRRINVASLRFCARHPENSPNRVTGVYAEQPAHLIAFE
jgi:hypothetical protein